MSPDPLNNWHIKKATGGVFPVSYFWLWLRAWLCIQRCVHLFETWPAERRGFSKFITSVLAGLLHELQGCSSHPQTACLFDRWPADCLVVSLCLLGTTYAIMDMVLWADREVTWLTLAVHRTMSCIWQNTSLKLKAKVCNCNWTHQLYCPI